jgi:reductive dehalogenase
MAYDSPIDAGIAEFCKRCKKCAEMCPAGALSFEDEPSWDVQGPWNQSGHKAWFEHAPKCLAYWRENSVSCTHCHIACPWAKKDKAWLHEFVKVTSSATPAFDRFFRTMDDAFGYGLKNDNNDQTIWWDLDLPAYGYDTTHGHGRV